MATSALNQRGEWVPAIPLPYYGLRKRCSCGRKFWTMAGYQGHYALAHVLALDPKARRPGPFDSIETGAAWPPAESGGFATMSRDQLTEAARRAGVPPGWPAELMPVEPAHLISGPGFTDFGEFGRPRRMARLRRLLSRRKRATVPECSPDHLTPAGPGNPSGIMIEDNQHRDCFSIRETDSSGVTTDLIHFCDWPALRSAIDQHQRERGGVT